jgi:hypothetical protein
MPTPTTAMLPKPRNDDEFEDIVVDCLRVRWGDPNVQRFGRSGQAQHGVDIIGRPARLNGKIAGGQCKCTKALSLADVIKEVDKAKTFPGLLAEFYVVASIDRDAKLQAGVWQHFSANPAPFLVEVIFWEDVTADLAATPNLVAKHWKGFDQQFSSGSSSAPNRASAEHRRRIAMLIQHLARLEGQQVQTPGYLWIAYGHEHGVNASPEEIDARCAPGLSAYMTAIDLESVRRHLRGVLETTQRLVSELEGDTSVAEEAPEAYLALMRGLNARARILQHALMYGAAEKASSDYLELTNQRDVAVEQLVRRLRERA